MIRRSFLKGLSSMGLLSVMDCVNLLDQELGLAHDPPDPAIPAPRVANPGRVPPSAATGDGVVMARLKQELSIIKDLGRMEEFRAIRALFSLAQNERIPCRLSGAGCSSIVAFLLGGSSVLPSRHDLVFERFRDPKGRWAPPFIIHVDRARKERLVEFAKSRYPRLVADGAFSFLPMSSVDMIPWSAADLVRRNGRPEFDLGQIPLDDQRTFDLLRSGDTQWVRFFHCRVVREELQRLEPTSIAELAALSALLQVSADHGELSGPYEQRAGTDHGPESVHPVVAETTLDSRGLILFQEQVMMVLNRLGGIPVEDGYDFIKAAAKKSEIVAQYQARFLGSARENGIAQEAAEAIFGHLRAAASYVCCKAGCVADAMVIYHGAYLKAHYPAEFSQAVRLAMA